MLLEIDDAVTEVAPGQRSVQRSAFLTAHWLTWQGVTPAYLGLQVYRGTL
jgi:hypothetical protein